MQKTKTSGLTVDKLLQTAATLKGFKKQPSVLKKLDGKYYEAGQELKKQGITSTDIIREIRDTR
jgi:hypothetical protein